MFQKLVPIGNYSNSHHMCVGFSFGLRCDRRGSAKGI